MGALISALFLLVIAGCASVDRSNPPVTDDEAAIVIRNKELIYGPMYWERMK